MNGIYIRDLHGYKVFFPMVSVLNALLERGLITEDEYDTIISRVANEDYSNS